MTRVNSDIERETAKIFWRSCIIRSKGENWHRNSRAALRHIERGAAFISRPDRAPYIRSCLSQMIVTSVLVDVTAAMTIAVAKCHDVRLSFPLSS